MATVHFQPIDQPNWLYILIAIAGLAATAFFAWLLIASALGLWGHLDILERGILGAVMASLTGMVALLLLSPMTMLYSTAHARAQERLDSAVQQHYRSTADLADVDLTKTGRRGITLLDPQGQPVLCVIDVERADLEAGQWIGSLDCRQNP